MQEKNVQELPESEPEQEIRLKGVIPAIITEPGEIQAALESVRAFLRQFPGLMEEVMAEREKYLQQDGRPTFDRN